MSRYPVVMLVGQAGSGKDTVADYLAEFKGVKIAQADPMKRFLMTWASVPEATLWGPSELRQERLTALSTLDTVSWLLQADVFVGATFRTKPHFREDATRELRTWMKQMLEVQPTIRTALQTLGTEWGRSLDPDVWVDFAIDTAKTLLASPWARYLRSKGLVGEGIRPSFVIITDGRFRNEVLKVKELGGWVVKIERDSVNSKDPHPSEQEQFSIPAGWFDWTIYNNGTMEDLRSQVRDLGMAVTYGV